MPHRTPRQEAYAALERDFVTSFVMEIEPDILAELLGIDDFESEGSDSDSDHASDDSFWDSSSDDLMDDGGLTESSSSSSDEEMESLERIEDAAAVFLAQTDVLYSRRYLNEREPVPKSRAFMDLLLGEYKLRRPEIFRSYVRITPACFDDLVAALQDDEIFHNRSNNPQMPLPEQLIIALYRFGHHGSSASILKVSLLFGVGAGTVHLVTSRVLKAACSERFRAASVQWPSDEAKERAKEYVEKLTCRAWRDGWLMVDGTLVPLFQRPGFYGNVWFDRKSNYSINVQLISTPDCFIIDYVLGLPGSQHDATAWEESYTYQNHDRLLPNGEFIWADSAYPLKSWCQAPYKAPEKAVGDNPTHNYHVSKVRVGSEHCVGFLKGRWSSLKGLRVAITNQKSLQYASFWIIACIHLHTFAMKHETVGSINSDKFYKDGKKYQRECRKRERRWRRARRRDVARNEEELDKGDDIALLEGKLKREELKEAMMVYLDQ